MPIYNHTAHNESAPWGYCHATGQDRWKVKDFLREKRQTPVDKGGRKSAGRPLALYGFKTNLLVLDKWLGDWLLNSPTNEWQHQDSEKPGKTFWVPKPERVCTVIDRLLYFTAIYKHTDEQAEQFRAVLRKHWRRWWNKVKDEKVRARFNITEIEAILAPGEKAWLAYCFRRRERCAEIMVKVREDMRPRNGLMPYAEVETAWWRFQGVPL
jgi:hypothetical protein